MSTFAFDANKIRHEAASGKPTCAVYCHHCGEEVYHVKEHTRRFGLYSYQAHFRHSPQSTCEIAKQEARETQEHKTMKDVIASMFDVVQEEKMLPDVARRPDLVIRGSDGIARAVECQHSPINLETVAGRIKDHNAAGLPSLWALSPVRLTDRALSIWDGVTEPMYSIVKPEDPLLSRVLRIDPHTQTAATAYALCHIASIDSPYLVPVGIDLQTHPLMDVPGWDGRVSIPAHDNDKFTFSLKKKLGSEGKAYQALGEHRRFVEYSELSKERARHSDEDFGVVWRRNMQGFAEDERKQYGGVDFSKTKEARVLCDRADKAKRDAEEREARRQEEIARQKRADAYWQHLAEVEAQRKRMDQARNAIKYAEPFIGMKGTFTNEAKRQIRLTLRRYGEALQIDLSNCQTIGEATRNLVREAHKIVNKGAL